MRRKKFEADLEALKRNLKKCDKNVVIFEEAINKELKTKTQLRRMIEELERKQNDGDPQLRPD